MALHPLDAGLVMDHDGDGKWRGETADAYRNMVGPFGGFVAAIFMKAVLADERANGHPVAQTVNYCGSIADGPFTIETRLERGGKYTQHWTLSLSQEAGVRATCTIVMGARAEVFAHQVVDRGREHKAEDFEPVPKGMPLPWINSYEFRFIEGAPRFTGEVLPEVASAVTKVFVRDDPPRPLDYLSLAALCDSFILRNLQMRGAFPPMGTVTLTSYFHATPDELKRQGDAPLFGYSDCKRVNNQFNDQQMELYATDGTLLASGAQIQWYKE